MTLRDQIAAVKTKNRGRGGRRPLLGPERQAKLVQDYLDGGGSLEAVGARYGVSRMTAARIVRAAGEG
jgi:transposase-like protein